MRTKAFFTMAAGLVLIGAGALVLSDGSATPADFGPSAAGTAGSATPAEGPVIRPSPRTTTSTLPDATRLGETVASAPGTPPHVTGSAPAAPPQASRTAPTAAPVSTEASPRSLRKPSGRPTYVRLPTVDVEASVLPVLSRDGELIPPNDPATLGWWLASASAGSGAGATILVGHVDSPAGPGALFRLTEVAVGDPVEVMTATGPVKYRVNSRRTYDKATGLPAGVLDTTGPARVVIITCGGDFDEDTRSYRDNVVVTALLSS